jgi:hypothetical protein
MEMSLSKERFNVGESWRFAAIRTMPKRPTEALMETTQNRVGDAKKLGHKE